MDRMAELDQLDELKAPKAEFALSDHWSEKLAPRAPPSAHFGSPSAPLHSLRSLQPVHRDGAAGRATAAGGPYSTSCRGSRQWPGRSRIRTPALSWRAGRRRSWTAPADIRVPCSWIVAARHCGAMPRHPPRHRRARMARPRIRNALSRVEAKGLRPSRVQEPSAQLRSLCSLQPVPREGAFPRYPGSSPDRQGCRTGPAPCFKARRRRCQSGRRTELFKRHFQER